MRYNRYLCLTLLIIFLTACGGESPPPPTDDTTNDNNDNVAVAVVLTQTAAAVATSNVQPTTTPTPPPNPDTDGSLVPPTITPDPNQPQPTSPPPPTQPAAATPSTSNPQPTPTSESDPTGFITGTYNNYDKPADRAYIYAVDASNPTDLWRFVIINIPQPPAGGGESYAVMEPFSIELPPGTYRLFAWSEDGSDYVAHATTLGGWQTVTVTADETKANINLWPPDSRYCARFAIPASPDNLFAGTTPNCGAAIRGVLLEPPTDAFYIDVYAVAVNDPTKYYKTSISQELDGSFPVYELLVDPGSYEIYAYADETDYGWGYAPDGDNLNQVNVANNSTILSDANLNPHISANKCHGFDMPDSPDGTYSGPIATGLVPCDDNNNPLWNRQPAQQLTTVELAAGTSQAYNLDGDSDTTNDIQFTDNGGQLQIQIQNGTRLYRGLGPNYAHDNGCPRAWEENQADFTTTPYIITVTDLCVYTSQGNLAELNISLVATTDTSFEFSFTTTLYTPNTSQ